MNTENNTASESATVINPFQAFIAQSVVEGVMLVVTLDNGAAVFGQVQNVVSVAGRHGSTNVVVREHRTGRLVVANWRHGACLVENIVEQDAGKELPGSLVLGNCGTRKAPRSLTATRTTPFYAIKTLYVPTMNELAAWFTAPQA